MAEERRKKGLFEGMLSNLFREGMLPPLFREGELLRLFEEETPEETAARKIEQQARTKFGVHYEHFKRYHDRKARGEKTNLIVIAKEAHLTHGYVRQLHMGCPYPQCQQQTRRRKKGTQEPPNEQKPD